MCVYIIKIDTDNIALASVVSTSVLFTLNVISIYSLRNAGSSRHFSLDDFERAIDILSDHIFIDLLYELFSQMYSQMKL